MPSRLVSELLGNDPIDTYLNQCQVRNSLVESEGATHVPPSAQETRELLTYLKGKGIAAVIVGSVGVLHYVKDQSRYRPTVDLDLFVPLDDKKMRAIPPPKGWQVDRESVGVISWISPSGGYVDYITAGKVVNDNPMPQSVQADPSSKDYPVAKAVELFRLKLGTMREKDLSDLMSLARAIGRVPTDAELGPLKTQTMKDNLDLVRQWFKLRPQGKYGE